MQDTKASNLNYSSNRLIAGRINLVTILSFFAFAKADRGGYLSSKAQYSQVGGKTNVKLHLNASVKNFGKLGNPFVSKNILVSELHRIPRMPF